MMGSSFSQKILILILAVAGLTGCTNTVPIVEQLVTPSTPAAPKDARNFMQLSAASQRQSLSGGYKGTVRVGPPLGRLQATTGDGYKLQGTVTFQR